VATEGGHADFAPRNEQEDGLNRFLRARYGHVSYERILSGPGISSIYAFLRDTGFASEDPALQAAMDQGDPSAAISGRALVGDDALSVETLRLFCEIYGAEAGNLALKTLAAGGVYIGGGIAPRIQPALVRGGFMQGFLDKGRFADLLGGFQVRLSLNPKAALLGAAHYALQAH
jgi:glucokinase